MSQIAIVWAIPIWNTQGAEEGAQEVQAGEVASLEVKNDYEFGKYVWQDTWSHGSTQWEKPSIKTN